MCLHFSQENVKFCPYVRNIFTQSIVMLLLEKGENQRSD